MKELHSNLIKIARQLSDMHYHSGDELGKSLGITRSAIWKALKKLEQNGIKINSVKGKGYALAEPLLLLDKHLIKRRFKLIDTTPIDLKIFASVTSTIDYLQTHPDPKNKIKICMAETQTHGRGRLNRSWYSPFGKNIYFSCRYSFQKDLCELSGLSLVTGLAILKSAGDFGILADLTVQWPNHIMWRQKKLAGCLIEVSAEAHGNCYAIISIGINVNSLHDDAHFPGVSMAQALGKSLDRNDVSRAADSTPAGLFAQIRSFRFFRLQTGMAAE